MQALIAPQPQPPDQPGRRAHTRQGDQGPVAEFVSRALRLDPGAIEGGLERMRRLHPGESDSVVARRCVKQAAWMAGATSFVLSLPDHPAVAIPAAMVEAVLLHRIQIIAMARIALLHEAQMLREGRDPVGALKAILGGNCAAEGVAALGATAGREACLAAIRSLTEIDAERAVGAVLTRVGTKVCSRTILVRAVPVLGAVATAIRSARAMRRETERGLSHLEPARAVEARAAATPAANPGIRWSGVVRSAAIEVVAAAIRTGDALGAATHRSREAVSALLAEARARARSSPESDCLRAAA